jgi:hypothetical protein
VTNQYTFNHLSPAVSLQIEKNLEVVRPLSEDKLDVFGILLNRQEIMGKGGRSGNDNQGTANKGCG